MAACVTLAALWTHRQHVAVRAENGSLAEQQRVAQAALAQAQGELSEAGQRVTEVQPQGRRAVDGVLKEEGDLAHFKISMLASMLGNSPAAVAAVCWTRPVSRRAHGVKAARVGFEKDYQFWVIDGQYPSPVSAGVFKVDPVSGEAHVAFWANKHVGSIAKFAVSLERKGGVPKPEGPIVLLSQ